MSNAIINTKYEHFNPVLDKVHILLDDAKNEFINNQNNRKWKKIIVSLMFRLYEQFDSVHLLAKNDRIIDSSIIYRSLYNLEVLIQYLLIDPSKKTEEYISQSNTLLTQIQRKISEKKSFFFLMLEDIYKLDNNLSSLNKKKKFRQKSIKQMAEEAGLIADYEFAYWLLSNIEHSNVSSIFELKGLPGLDLVSKSSDFPYFIQFLVLNSSIISVIRTTEKCSNVMKFKKYIQFDYYWNEYSNTLSNILGVNFKIDNTHPDKLRFYDTKLNILKEYSRT